jgi:hypothetical protein
MNKHWVLCLVALIGMAGCQRSTQLAVRAVATAGEEEIGRSQQIIRLIPYDRDAIFDMLASQSSAPEPEPPEDLIMLRDSVSVAREMWTEAEAVWNDMRSEMQELSEQMQRMDRSSREYFTAYQRFDELDAQVRRLDRAKNNYFDVFTNLQTQYRTRADSFNAVMEAWGDLAFERYGEIVDSLIELHGEELEDTADAAGWTSFVVPRGEWWIHTRAKLVFEELYWNVPYQSGGGVDTLVLNESNAEVRSIF